MQILIVEDDPISRRILESLLNKWGYSTISARNGLEAWDLMQGSNVPNFVISDWMMPNLTGIALCKRIRDLKTPGYIYFILLTTKTEKKDIIRGLEAGADDYIVKPFDREELQYRVKIGERIIRLEKRIVSLANTDYLTGVLNRRAFMERFDKELNRCFRHGRALSVILADIDHFKRVNDEYGHLAGDSVLKRFAEILRSHHRPYDVLGRYGGEEFILCLPETDLSQAVSAAERMRKIIAGTEFVLPDWPSGVIRITASFGIFSDILSQQHLPEALIKLADDALYRAKEKGRNRIEIVPDGTPLSS